MKKILVFILSIAIILSFVACSQNNKVNNEESKPTQSTEETTTPEKTPETTLPEEDTEVEILNEIVDVVPKGATYYHNNTKWEDCRKIFEFELGEKFTEGQIIPEVCDGDILIYQNMLYVYNGAFSDSGSYGLKKTELNGWSVYCLSVKGLTEVYLLNAINEKPVVRASYLFQYDNDAFEVTKITVSSNIKDISYMLSDCRLENDLSIIFNGTPEKYASCLNISVPPTFNEDKITYESTHTITISGNCDEVVKNNISGETEVAMNIEIK